MERGRGHGEGHGLLEGGGKEGGTEGGGGSRRGGGGEWKGVEGWDGRMVREVGRGGCGGG